jgi:lipopolysaccharide transport system ATP-binding protein
MTDDTVIRAEGLGKKYVIGHQTARGAQGSFREAVAGLVKGLSRSLASMARGQALIVGDATEEFWALKDVSFEIKRGEVLGIIGRNGAGKSTLLKILSRITEPTEGRAEIHGRVASLLEVGTGFQPELTGRENIYLNGAILGMARAEIRQRFDEIVAFAGVERFLDTPVKRYSSGMYVRLAFAVAAHLEPEILIVDEVLAVGDEEFQKKCLGKMGAAAKEGRTVILVSHNMNSVERLSRRLCFLQQGRIVGIYDNVREGIINYLGLDSVATENIWINDGKEPKNEYFQPSRLEVRTTGPNSSSIGPLSNEFPMRVSVFGFIKQAESDLNIGIAVYNDKGETMFWTFMTDTPKDQWPRLTLGPIEVVTTIPARLLNEGKYRIELIAGLRYRGWLFEPGGQVPSVACSIKGGLSDSPVWYEKRPGCLSIVLPWCLAENTSDERFISRDVYVGRIR